MGPQASNLIWIDLEMTGLDTDNDHIIEIATIVTDAQLHVLDEGPVYAIHQDVSVMEAMDDWNRNQHRNSGLTERVLASSTTLAEAEAATLAFLAEWVPSGASPMCGNSICQDRRFLHREMPQLEQYFHYRNLDVSTIKELVARWAPAGLVTPFVKNSEHLALADVRDSIAELRHYREQVFVPALRAD